MHVLDKQTERAIKQLTQLAYGDVTIVRDALAKHGNRDLKSITNFIIINRDPQRRPVSMDVQKPA